MTRSCPGTHPSAVSRDTRSPRSAAYRTGCTRPGTCRSLTAPARSKSILSPANPLSTDGGNIGTVELLRSLGDTGKVYLLNVRDVSYGRRLIECLRVIAEADHPLVFHCSAGKDRTGVLAACLLSVLGVDSGNIVEDYTLTGPYMARHIELMSRDPNDAKFLQGLPAFILEASAASMELFLSTMKQDYGSIRDYLLAFGDGDAARACTRGAILGVAESGSSSPTPLQLDCWWTEPARQRPSVCGTGVPRLPQG